MKLHYITFTLAIKQHLKLFLEPNLILPYLLPQTAIFGFLDEPDNQNFVLLNRLLLLLKLNVCNSRRDKVLCFNKLLRDIIKVNKMEKRQGFQSQTEITKSEKKMENDRSKNNCLKIFPDSSSYRGRVIRVEK